VLNKEASSNIFITHVFNIRIIVFDVDVALLNLTSEALNGYFYMIMLSIFVTRHNWL